MAGSVTASDITTDAAERSSTLDRICVVESVAVGRVTRRPGYSREPASPGNGDCGAATGVGAAAA